MSFAYYATLTYDHTLCGTADSSGFPALIYASGPTLRDVAHGGYVNSSTGADILVFSGSSLATQIPSEIDYYDNVNGIVWVWAYISTLSHTADGTVCVALGNASPPARTGGVWNSALVGVYHLPGSADSTSNGLNATYNSMTSTLGKIGNAAASTNVGGISSTTYIQLPANSIIDDVFRSSQYAFSFWFNLAGDQSGQNAQIFGTYPGTTYAPCVGPGVGGLSGFGVVQAGFQVVTSTSMPSSGAWHHCLVTWSHADSDTLRLYIDNVLVGSGNTYNVSIQTTGAVFSLGGSDYLYVSVNGATDELRIRSAVPTDSLRTAEYNNQNSPGNIGAPGFWTWGSWVPTASGSLFRPAMMNGLGGGGPFFINPLG